MVLSSWYFVLCPSFVLGAWSEGHRTKDQGRTKNEELRTKD